MSFNSLISRTLYRHAHFPSNLNNKSIKEHSANIQASFHEIFHHIFIIQVKGVVKDDFSFLHHFGLLFGFNIVELGNEVLLSLICWLNLYHALDMEKWCFFTLSFLQEFSISSYDLFIFWVWQHHSQMSDHYLLDPCTIFSCVFAIHIQILLEQCQQTWYSGNINLDYSVGDELGIAF